MDFGGKSVILFISSGVQRRTNRSFFILWYNRVVMVSLIVKNIIEEDFGCEGRPAGYEPKCKVILRDFNGNEMEVDVKDADLYAKDINIGDQVHFDGDEIIKE